MTFTWVKAFLHKVEQFPDRLVQLSTAVFLVTTTKISCNSSCLNQTWISSANLLAQWLFDGSFRDQLNNYNATPVNNMSFATYGYVNQAIQFTANANNMLNVPYIPLSNTSFTIDMWLFITGLLNVQDHDIFSYCSQPTIYMCLHLTIRQNNSNYHLYLGFLNADCEGVTSLTLNIWIHAAFVFDITTLTQKIYLNGVLENSCNQTSAVTSAPANITIGYIPAFTTYANYYQVNDFLSNSLETQLTIKLFYFFT
jgi:hypothetical protein